MDFSIVGVIELFIGYVFGFVEFVTKKRVDPSKFEESNYYPQQKEIYATDLKILGSLPKDLNGAYIRVGPNTRYFIGGDTHT